jgi:hypothetical protein
LVGWVWSRISGFGGGGGGGGFGEAVAIELTRQRPANPGIAVKGAFGVGNAGTGAGGY